MSCLVPERLSWEGTLIRGAILEDLTVLPRRLDVVEIKEVPGMESSSFLGLFGPLSSRSFTPFNYSESARGTGFVQ